MKVKIKSSTLYKLFKNPNILNEGFWDDAYLDDDIINTPSIQKYSYTGDYKSNSTRSKELIEKTRLDLWDSILNKKQANLDNIYGKKHKSVLSNDVYKINPRLMYDELDIVVYDDETGESHQEKIVPAEVIAMAESIKDAAMVDPIFGPIVRRFDKPIIWTLNRGVNTAASDGIRIAYNVIFAYTLLQKGKADWLAMKAAGQKGNVLLTTGKYWLFVFIHETYHELYEHNRQAQLKKETADGKNHNMANVAMDAEINRDIEAQIPILHGCAKAINGVMDPNFPSESWDIIFDEYYYNDKPMPNSENPPSMTGGDPEMDQLIEQGVEQNQDNQSGNSSKSGQSGNESSNNSNNQSGDSDDMQNSQQSNNSSSNSQKSSRNNSQSSPAGTSGDDEYDDAYNDELRNIMDLMNGNKSNKNNGKPRELTEKDIDNIVNQIKDAIGSGMKMEDIVKQAMGNNNQQNGMDADVKMSEEAARKLSNELSRLEDLAGTSMQEALDQIKQQTMSKTEQAAREQALKDVKAAMDQMEADAESQAQSAEQQSSQQAGKGTSSMPVCETSSKFGGRDMVSKEELSKIAEEQGEPYTASELTSDRNKINEDYIKENLDKLNKVSNALGKKIEDIRNKLKDVPVITNWKNKLKRFLKNQAEGDIEQIRSKRVMSQTWRKDRYMPYKDRLKEEEFGGVDVFYLIDNSGSMWGAGFGENIFIQIFAEIIGIEKACNIQKSALAYFSGDNIIPPDKIRLWDASTKKSKIISMIGLGDRDQSGGTDIGGNIIAVTNMKKPYYYNNGKKHTLLIVFTDGEDPSQYKQIASIPARIKKDVVFCLINRKSSILNIMSDLHTKSGVNVKNIICICTDEFNK